MTPQADPLAGLRDLALPEAVSWWPVAPGWWILLLIVLVLIGLALRRWKKSSADSWLKQARLELDDIKQIAHSGQDNNVEVIERCSALFRRVALALEPRENIAALTGRQWLEKLDDLSGSCDFTEGYGQTLESHVWQKPQTRADLDVSRLLELLEGFVERGAAGRGEPRE